MKGLGSTADVSDEMAETLEFSNPKENDLQTRASFTSGSTKPDLSCPRRKESIAMRFVKMFDCE